MKAALWVVGILVVVAAILRATVFDVWVVPEDDQALGLSVMPGLAAGDTVVLATRGKLSVGDLVRCPDPQSTGKWVVGRIMGEGYDKLHLDESGLAINGRKVPTAMGCDSVTVKDPVTNADVQLQCNIEDYAGRRYPRLVARRADLRNAPVDSAAEIGQLYLLSDNRYYHVDSRDFGLVPKASCSGRVVFRLWSAAGWSDGAHRLAWVQ